MKKSVILLQFCHFRARAVFHRYGEVLHGRATLIGIAVVLLIPPSAVSAYLHGWVEISQGHLKSSSAFLALSLTGFLNLFLLFLYAKQASAPALTHFELSLPLGPKNRYVAAWVEAMAIQIPSLFLLLIACGDEVLSTGHGIRFSEFGLIVLGFLLLMSINHWILTPLQKLPRLGRFFVPLSFGLSSRLSNQFSNQFSTPALIKLTLWLRNQKRQGALKVSLLALLSFVGWSIAFVQAPEQPKVFIWTLLLGLIFLVLIPLSYTLDDLDEEVLPFLNSLPASLSEHRFANLLSVVILCLPFLLQAALWPLTAGAGWKTSLTAVFWFSFLLFLSLGVRQLSRKWFMPNFLILIVWISWVAEKLSHDSI